MLKENLVYPEGLVDVSIIAIVCFDNPLKEYAITFLSEALTQKKRIVIPVSSIIGAYHITTRYLKASKISVKNVLEKLLATRSPAFYPQISPELALEALEYATYYNIESWDGYLISTARNLKASIIYSLDKELEKVKEVTIVNPFPEEAVKQYHEFMKKL
ncbi:MAG: type II toxin-antitoxin system VapC family toxin [Candidatus Bathyarchaeia archaeon]